MGNPINLVKDLDRAEIEKYINANKMDNIFKSNEISYEEFNQHAEQLAVDFLNTKKSTITDWSDSNVKQEFKQYIYEYLKQNIIAANITADTLFKNGEGDVGIQHLLGAPNGNNLKENYESLYWIIKAQALNEIFDVMFNSQEDLNTLKDELTDRNANAKTEVKEEENTDNTAGALKKLYKTIINSQPEGNEVVNEELTFTGPKKVEKPYTGQEQDLLEPGVTLSGSLKNEYKVRYYCDSEIIDYIPKKTGKPNTDCSYNITWEIVEKDNSDKEYSGDNYPSRDKRTITSKITASNEVEDNDDSHNGNNSQDTKDPVITDDNRVSGDSPLKEGHKDIATHYQDTDEEKAEDYKAAEKAKIKKKQDRIRARRDKKVEKLQQKAEKAKENGHEKRAERKNAKAHEISREKEAKAASKATKNEVTTRKNVGKSFYAVIDNYKEQGVFSEDVNEDVLKRIPLKTWREFNNIFGELLKDKNPNDSEQCKTLMSGDTLKKELKSCKDATHLRALKKFWESCTVGQMKVIYEANRNTADYDITFMRKALDLAKDKPDLVRNEPFYFLADLDKMGNVNTDKVTISGSESQLYSAFLHGCTVKDRVNGGYFEIIDGDETKAVIKQFFKLTAEYNPAAIQKFKNKHGVNEITTLKDFGEFLSTYPDFSVFYVNKLNRQTGGNAVDLFDLVTGKIKAKTTEQIRQEENLKMAEWNSMEEWEEALDKLMKDPNMFAHLDQGVNTLGSLERHSKASLMMMLSNALDNQFLQLVTNFFGINGEKDVKIPASVKGQFLAKCRFDVRIFKDLHGFGSHLKGHKIAGGFGLEIPQDAINWLIGEIVPGVVGKLKDLKSGCFTLNIPILTAEFAKSLNADRIAQSNARNANAFQELLFDVTAGVQFGWKLGKAPIVDSPLVDIATDVTEQALKNLEDFNNNLDEVSKGISTRVLDVDENGNETNNEVYCKNLLDVIDQVVEKDKIGETAYNEIRARAQEKKVTKKDLDVLAKGISTGVKELNENGDETENNVYCNDWSDIINNVVQKDKVAEGVIDAIINYQDQNQQETEDPEIQAEKEKFERFSANLTLEAGIGYKRDFLRGIEGINSTIKDELDKAIEATLKASPLNADDFGVKFLEALGKSPTYKNNKDFFQLIAKDFKDVITPDVWEVYHKDNNTANDFKMILSEMIVGFVEYARADQVRQLDRRTKLTELHAGIGWHFDLRHLKRKDFFILKFSATVSSFMMKHVENTKKLQYMDTSLRSGIGMDDYEALEGNDLDDLANALDKKIRLNGLIITATDNGEIKIAIDQTNAPKILNGSLKGQAAERVDQVINIHNNGCEEGKDFYYKNGELYLGDIKNLSIARRNYLDTQQVYLFLCGAEGKPGVDHTQGDHLPITKDIPEDKDFHNLDANAERGSFKLEEVQNTIEGLKLKDGTAIGKEVREKYQNNFKEVNGKIQFTDDDGIVHEDIQSKKLIFTKDNDEITVKVDSSVSYGKEIHIKIIDKNKEGNNNSQENNITITSFDKTDLGINEGTLKNNEGAEFTSEDEFFENRDVGLGLIYLKKRGMTGTDYNDFLNHLGGGSNDDINKAIQILQSSLENIIKKFTRDPLSVRGKRKSLGGGEAYTDFKIQKAWYEGILNALKEPNNPNKALLCQRIAGIMAHEELLYLNTSNEIWQGLQFIVKQRGNYYEKLYGPAGKQFPLPGIRDTLIEKFKNNKDLLTNKDIVPGLFGYTAYYASGNTLDRGSGGGQTFNPTVMEHTAVLGGKEGLLSVPSDKQEAAGMWLKKNIQLNGQGEKIKEMIIKKLKESGNSEDTIQEELKKPGDILFDENGKLRSKIELTIDGKKVTINLETQMVFYLYAACGNESLGLQVEGITIEGGGGGGGNGNEVTGNITGESHKGFALNVASDRQSSTMVVTAMESKMQAEHQEVIDTSKPETGTPPPEEDTDVNTEQTTGDENSEYTEQSNDNDTPENPVTPGKKPEDIKNLDSDEIENDQGGITTQSGIVTQQGENPVNPGKTAEDLKNVDSDEI